RLILTHYYTIVPRESKEPFHGFLPRLLLRQAVQRAESKHKVNGMDPNHRPIFEEFCQCTERDAIVWVVECRHQHGGVGNIKVGVTGGQTLAVKIKRRRHWQRHYCGPRPVLQTKILYSLPILP